ncbi:hypothetical protein LLEC1_00441 [Akanthomyces lecanii]|uniref:Glucose N-acetyltransferase 1 n=1 Tax=Cordyceps confragosa TaxID=2714763 RepID=A0A179IKA9_CORDF|nr:hypothetical protein LLEC1_00441 [Akanthomyces lecanii]
MANMPTGRRLRFLPTVAVTVTVTVLLLYNYTQMGPSSTRSHLPAQNPSSIQTAATVDWSKFAYVQYVTNSQYLCNSVMLFETLDRLGSKADRLMMSPAGMAADGLSNTDLEEARLLTIARDRYNVRLQPIEVQSREGKDSTWAESFTKLLSFNQTQYDRVLSLDSDGTVLQSMDELFLLPPCPVAMPRAYWLYPDTQILSSQVMLVQPSAREFGRVMAAINIADGNDYDMEIVNTLYKDQALVLPHRPYDMLTAEFRRGDHSQYLGSNEEPWDPVEALNEAKFLHFSDWPVPKPWLEMSDEVRAEKQPSCSRVDGVERCVEREMWNGFYTDFAQRRKSVQRICSSKED